jgi:hypothetical protein
MWRQSAIHIEPLQAPQWRPEGRLLDIFPEWIFQLVRGHTQDAQDQGITHSFGGNLDGAIDPRNGINLTDCHLPGILGAEMASLRH